MNRSTLLKASLLASLAGLLAWPAAAGEISFQSAPPVVVKTVPVAGSVGVDPGLTEIRVTFSKPMLDQCWSWSTWGVETFPETTGKPHYLPDGRTCVLPVKLRPGRFYATWLNSEKFHGFQDTNNQPAAPYLLSFETAAGPSAENAGASPELNAEQRLVLEWTERAFRPVLDTRTLADCPEPQRTALESRALEALKGEPSEEHYRGIASLAALRSAKAIAPLEALAGDRRQDGNRARWMAVRALGLLGDKKAVPELVHLLYHFNGNTRWWAQISLVRLTGVNFGKDWRAWGKWWNEHDGQPAFKPELVRWQDDPLWTDPAKLEPSVAAADMDFLREITNQQNKQQGIEK